MQIPKVDLIDFIIYGEDTRLYRSADEEKNMPDKVMSPMSTEARNSLQSRGKKVMCRAESADSR